MERTARRAAASGREFVRDWRNERTCGVGGGAEASPKQRRAGLAAADGVSKNAARVGAGEGEPGPVSARARARQTGGHRLHAVAGSHYLPSPLGDAMPVSRGSD